MATRLFSTMEQLLAPSVPGCPLPTLINYVRAAARETCEKTLAWRYQQDDVRLTPGVYDYDYDVPAGTEVCGVVHVTLNGEPISFVVQEYLHSVYPDWPSNAVNKRGQPRYVTQFNTDQFLIAPVPDSTQSYDLRMFLALKPLPDADSMDKAVLDELEETIMHGALQHLLVLPDKSWTDRELASYHAKQYTYKTASRRAKTNLGVGRGQMRVRSQPFA